ncbi:MAG: hypothetical protein JRI70_02460 [Deltaproteobacteria bacterium]|nr:hypothetical protein [Deltaproteobacteria bacterium]
MRDVIEAISKTIWESNGPACGGIAKPFKVFKFIPLTAGLPFFAVPRLALSPDPHFEMDYSLMYAAIFLDRQGLEKIRKAFKSY